MSSSVRILGVPCNPARLNQSPRTQEEAVEVIECRNCTAGTCNHGDRCPTMIRWYDDPWDGTFWRRCECTAWVHTAAYPVTVTHVAKDGFKG